MPRSRGLKEYSLPMQGFNTEVNILNFPQQFAVDSLNIEPDYDPQTLRPRKGIERSGLPRLADIRTSGDNDIEVSSFLWSSVNRDSSVNLIAVQLGRYLSFYNDDTLNDPTSGIIISRIDLNDVLSGTTSGTLAEIEKTRLSYANVKGKLMITAPQIDPTLITYDGTTLSVAKLDLKIRDMQGVADGLEVDERPPVPLSDDHKYNLLNQGWYQQRRATAGSGVLSDPIGEFFAFTTKYPSNSDIVWLGMVDVTGDLIFDPQYLQDQTFGSTSAPKGHYVLSAFNKDRASALASPLVSGNTTSGSNYDGIPVDSAVVASIPNP